MSRGTRVDTLKLLYLLYIIYNLLENILNKTRTNLLPINM